jgi:excisionase family DNA binding protein
MMEGYIHLSKSTIYKMVSKNTIPHIKKGTRTIFEREQIDRWMVNGTSDDLPQFPKI